jgi:hypothetical protein
MMTYAMLIATLLGGTAASPQPAAPPQRESRNEIVIPFAWQPTEARPPQIREYQFRHGMVPTLRAVPWNIELREFREHRGLPPRRAAEVSTINKLLDLPVLRIDVIESHYLSDLRSFFERAKNLER